MPENAFPESVHPAGAINDDEPSPLASGEDQTPMIRSRAAEKLRPLSE